MTAKAVPAAVFAVTLGAACSTSAQVIAQSGPGAAAVNDFTQEYFERHIADGDAPGAVVAVVLDGEVVHLAGYGAADIESGRTMDPSATVMRLGSVSKPLTAIVAIEAVESGLVLSYDESLLDLLDRAGIGLVTLGAGGLSLHNLLTHTSGFGDRLLGQHARTAEAWVSLGDFLGRRPPPALLPPDDAVIYSDLGLSLAGAALEQLTAEPFSDLARRLLFSRLGMTRSSFNPLLNAPLREDIAAGYRWTGAGFRAVPYDYVMTTPAVGAVSTAADMGRLMTTLLSGGIAPDGERVLDQDSVVLLTRRMATNHENMRGRAYGFSEKRVGGYTAWFHDGSVPGFSANLSLVPELSLGVFVAANAGSVVGLGALSPSARLTRGLVEALVGLWPDRPREAVAQQVFQPDNRVDFEGAYRDAGIDRDTPFKLRGLIEQVPIDVISELRIIYDGQSYRKVGLDFFQGEEDRSDVLRFLRAPDGSISFLLLPNATLERVSPWESFRFQRRVGAIALGLIALGTLVMILALLLGWWGRLANFVGLGAGLGALGMAAWVGVQVYTFSLDVVLVNGLSGLPFPPALWMPVLALAPLSFLFALFGRGVHASNRWALVAVAVGWSFYYPVLDTWNLLG